MYESVFKALDEALTLKEHSNKYLREENEKLTAENRVLKDKIAELEREIKVVSGISGVQAK